MYVLDSSAFIELLRDSALGKRIARKVGDSLAVTTSFSVTELLIGAKGAEEEAIEKLLEGVEVLSFDKGAAMKSVSIEKNLLSKGKMINKVDIFIAGICLVNKMDLITLDKHFKEVPGLKLVKV